MAHLARDLRRTEHAQMNTNQLLDALTDHLALYHRRSQSASDTKASARTKVLEWLRTLSTEQRHTLFTVCDEHWVAVVLQMQKRLKQEGKGYFFLLTDVLECERASTSQDKLATSHLIPLREPEQKKARKFHKARKKIAGQVSVAASKPVSTGLPGLCFRKAKGILARQDVEQAAGELLCQSLELSSSSDTASMGLNSLDTMTVSDDLVSDMDQFVAIMDGITHGEFLSSISGRADSSWEELPWLKAMGYYTLPAFITNKLELLLWSAWLQADGSRRPPRNLAIELRKIGKGVKTSSNDVSTSSVHRRTKAFSEWWMNLREDLKLKALRFAVTTAAKAEIQRASHSTNAVRHDYTSRTLKVQESGLHTMSLSDTEFEQSDARSVYDAGSVFGSCIMGIKALIMLANSFSFIRNTVETGASEYPWLFHSSLYLADTLPDHVMRRVRNALHMAMLESMEADLLSNEVVTNQVNLKDPEGKVKKDNRRKKIRNSSQGKARSNFGNELVGKNSGLSLEGPVSNQQQEGEFISQSMCNEKKLEGSSKQTKKKKHSRAKSKAVREAGPAIESEDDYRSNHEDVRKLESEVTSTSLMCVEKTEDLQTVKMPIVEEDNESSFTKANCPKARANECTVEKESFRRSLKLVDKCSQQFWSEEKVTGHFSNKQLTAKISPLEISSNSSTRAVCQNNETSVTAVEISTDEILRCTTSTPNASEKRTDSCFGRDIQGTPSTVDNFSTSNPVYNFHCASPMPFKPLTEGYNSSFHTSVSGLPSAHEWPGAFQLRVSMGRSQMMLPATERLHLDVGRNWQQRLQAPFVALRTPVMLQPPSGSGSISKGSNSASSNFVGLDCSAMYSAGYTLSQKRGCSLGFREEAGYMALPQSAFPSPFLGLGTNTIARAPEEFKHDDRTPDDTDYDDPNYFSGDFDDHEGHLISEEECERQFLGLNLQGEGDYNQYFGGGVMFWNTADYSGTGYSRPPSLSSEDSSWARHEADFSVVLDDIMGLSGALPNVASPNMVSTSPPTASYSPGFEQTAVNTLPRANLSVSGNEISGKFPPLPPNVLSAKSDDEQMKCPKSVGTLGLIEGHTADILARPGLRPIIVVRDNGVNRQMPTSEFVRHQEARSPHIPRKLEVPRQRRPPSPVLRCVPPAPPPPPPSPVGGIGKRKGLTTVRSGSSSPRRWGLGTAYHKDEQDISLIIPEARDTTTNFFRSRSWADKSPMHPISSALLRERLFAIPALALEQDHPDIALPLQTTALYNSNPSLKPAISRLHTVLHEEIESFCTQVAAENLLRKPYISAAVDKVVHAMQVLWPRSRLKIFGSNATGLALPSSDVDLVVCLPPVRNLEPIKEAGILEGRNGIKETCLQHAARYLTDQDWVKGDTLKTIENTAIPIIMLVAHVPPHVCSTTHDNDGPYDSKQHLEEDSANEKKNGPWGGKTDREFVRLDISFEGPSHTGLRTAELVRELAGHFPAIVPLALILKQFLTDRSLDHPYTGGLSSYCLVLLITRFLQHQHHLGWPYQQNLGSLLMDFLHFFGCVFDPRRMGVRIRGGGMYVNRDRGHSIDPLHIEDPLCPSNNVGRNCFRILQCVKAFADAYSYIEKTLVEIADTSLNEGSLKILSNILPSVASLESLSEMSA